MPSPVFIIVSGSAVEDRRTNLLSVFNVVERLVIRKKLPDEQLGVPGQFRQVDLGESPSTHFGFSIQAVWMLEPSDPPEGTFDAELLFTVPPHNRQVRHSMPPLEYKKGGFLVRFGAVLIGPPPCDGSGILRVAIRIRRAGEQKWFEQEYPILLESIDETDTDGKPTVEASDGDAAQAPPAST